MRWMLRARVCDPMGPRWVLSVAPALGFALLVIVPLAPLTGIDVSTRVAASLLGVTILFARQFFRIVPPSRDGRLRLDPGAIVIVDAGLLNQRIRASEVVAASTARTAAGAALAIVRRGLRERPLLLDFASDADLDAVRRTLGLGHLGFGVVGWPTQPGVPPLQGSAALAFAWLSIAMCAALDAPLLGFALALVILPATVAALLVSCLKDPRAPSVALTSSGLLVTDFVAAGTIRYSDVAGAGDYPEGVFVATGAGSVTIPMARSLPEERQHLVAQILSAAARARGEGPRPPTLPPELARLARRGESERAWLQRIDATAAALASVRAYRGGALLEPRDLMCALESPDAPARVRAAVARVLARVDPVEARTSVARALASNRDAYTHACIQAALEADIDTAAQELEDVGRRYAVAGLPS